MKEFISIALIMLFMHTIADYNLQGWLASAKQKSWWEKNAPDDLYKHDWLAVLFMHSFAWAFLIMLPIAVVCYSVSFNAVATVFTANLILHMVIDDQKANRHRINLIEDQLLHVGQIIITALIFIK